MCTYTHYTEGQHSNLSALYNKAAVQVFYKDAFEKHAALFQELGVNPNNGVIWRSWGCGVCVCVMGYIYIGYI